jgi:hypothetical protein
VSRIDSEIRKRVAILLFEMDWKTYQRFVSMPVSMEFHMHWRNPDDGTQILARKVHKQMLILLYGISTKKRYRLQEAEKSWIMVGADSTA